MLEYKRRKVNHGRYINTWISYSTIFSSHGLQVVPYTDNCEPSKCPTRVMDLTFHYPAEWTTIGTFWPAHGHLSSIFNDNRNYLISNYGGMINWPVIFNWTYYQRPALF